MKPQLTEAERTSSEPHSAPSSNHSKNPDHVSGDVAAQAQRLLNEVGSVELAKQAVDVVGNSATPSDDELEHKNLFALALNFESYEQLAAASEPVASNDGLPWRLTPLANDTWAVWNDSQLHLDRHYASREEALANVPHDARFSGSCLLG